MILGLVVVLSFEDKERWDELASSIDSSNQGNLFTITWLLADRVEPDL